jgi:3-isopropylmalate/(R)-2-methylmalate dehydratase small subunit
MAKAQTVFTTIRGRVIPLPGDEIDTDRIIPARFLKAITFEDIGKFAFYDERFDEDGGEKPHPLNDARFRGGSVLLVNKNFGCGSSREHAPQALMGYGIRAFVGESFAEIFAGNCTALGMPAARVTTEAAREIMRLAAEAPGREIVINLEKKQIDLAGITFPFEMPEANRRAFLLGTWDTLETLLANREEIESQARSLPYLNGFHLARN